MNSVHAIDPVSVRSIFALLPSMPRSTKRLSSGLPTKILYAFFFEKMTILYNILKWAMEKQGSKISLRLERNASFLLSTHCLNKYRMSTS